LESDGRLPLLFARAFAGPWLDEPVLNPVIPRHRPRFQNDVLLALGAAESAGGDWLPSSIVTECSVNPGVGGADGSSCCFEFRLSFAGRLSFTSRDESLSGGLLNTLAVGLVTVLLALFRAGDAPAYGCFLASLAVLYAEFSEVLLALVGLSERSLRAGVLPPFASRAERLSPPFSIPCRQLRIRSGCAPTACS